MILINVLQKDISLYPETHDMAFYNKYGAPFQEAPLQVVLDNWYRSLYQSVAEVETNDLEEAYMLTNSISKGWWKNSRVNPKFKGDGCRSTSVGDLVIREYTEEDIPEDYLEDHPDAISFIEMYQVADAGFKRVF